MLDYLLKSGACLSIFLLFYKLLLENESIHYFKRGYLLVAIIIAFCIPLITFTEYVQIVPTTTQFTETVVPNLAVEPIPIQKSPVDYLPLFLWAIYGLGALVFGFRFIGNINTLVRRIRKNPKYRTYGITNVLLRESVIPHTFFEYIFWNKQKYEAHQIPDEVIVHEETHAKQKHSADVLFVELLQVFFWFNPLIYWAKHMIKLNHEFLADQAVLKNGFETPTYQNRLLEYSSHSKAPHLVNSINYSSIKKRFTVMKTRTSKKSALLRSLVILPILGLLLYSFSETKVIQIQQSETQTSNAQMPPTYTDSTEKDKFYGKVTFMFKDENGKIIRQAKYSELTPQEKSTLIAPENLSLKPNSPTKKDLNDWKDQNIYGVWLDGKRIDNDQLSNYEPNAFGTFFISKLSKNAKNYGRHFYQVNLYSNDEYKKQSNNVLLPLDKEVEIYISHTFNTKAKVIPIYQTSFSEKQKDSLKFIKDWYITIEGKKYYYLKDTNKVWHYYNSAKKEIKLDIVAEYKKKYNKYYALKSNGIHYIDKSENEQLILDILFSELGGMYFRTLREDRSKIKRPISPYAPYIKIIKHGKTMYKKLDELTEEDKKFIPALPPSLNIPNKTTPQKSVTKQQIKEYNALAKKYNEMDRNHFQVIVKEVKRLEYIHSLMTPKQKENAEPFPDFPEPPAPLKAPKAPKEPKAPNVTKDKKSDLPPPPPSVSNVSDVEYADKIIEEIISNQDPQDGPVVLDNFKGGKSTILPTSRFYLKPVREREKKIQKGKFFDRIDIEPVGPPVPPEPKSPLDHVIEMAKKDATFFFEGKKISSDKAIAILKKNDEINIRTKHEGLKNPIVELSTKPIIIKK